MTLALTSLDTATAQLARFHALSMTSQDQPVMAEALRMSAAHLVKVRAILQACLPDGVDVLVAGSRARGGAKRFSDL